MKKFEIDLNFAIRNREGKEINRANKIVANVLDGAVEKDESKITKFFGWADDLSKGNKLELDEADLKILHAFIKEHEGIFIVAKYPILKALDFSQPPAPGTGGKK